MTQPPRSPGMPPRPPVAQVTARPNVLERAKLAEPVRLYLYGASALMTLCLLAAAVASDGWHLAAAAIVAVWVTVLPAGMAVRASVFSARSHVLEVHAARGPVYTAPAVDLYGGQP